MRALSDPTPFFFLPVPMQDGGIDDPTLDVVDPAWAEDEEDLALDLKRRPRPEAMASWVAAAEGVDPFKVRACRACCLVHSVCDC